MTTEADSTERQSAFVERLRAEPERGRVTLRSTSDLDGGMRCEAQLRKHSVWADEPASIGGTDTAASPVELLLASLSTCQAITYRVWANELGVRLDRVRVELEGDIDLRGLFGLDDDVRPGFGALRVRVALEGPEPAERYRELADAVDRHCPLLDAAANAVPVERSLIDL